MQFRTATCEPKSQWVNYYKTEFNLFYSYAVLLPPHKLSIRWHKKGEGRVKHGQWSPLWRKVTCNTPFIIFIRPWKSHNPLKCLSRATFNRTGFLKPCCVKHLLQRSWQAVQNCKPYGDSFSDGSKCTLKFEKTEESSIAVKKNWCNLDSKAKTNI